MDTATQTIDQTTTEQPTRSTTLHTGDVVELPPAYVQPELEPETVEELMRVVGCHIQDIASGKDVKASDYATMSRLASVATWGGEWLSEFSLYEGYITVELQERTAAIYPELFNVMLNTY